MQKSIFYLCLMLIMVACGSSGESNDKAEQATAHEESAESTLTLDKEPQVLYLVRHAEKADDGTKNPPLTEQGMQRAAQLKDMLADAKITRIYSTDFTRTKDTAEPLCKALGIRHKIYQPGNKAFINMLKNDNANNALIVGHSNSTPTLVNTLIGEEKYEQLDESDYDKLFVLTRSGDKFTCEVQTFK